jgi:3-hydroxyisobutyrate dehydrogenase
MSVRIGFIGLGNLGGHLASSLLRAGFEVIVHDLRPEQAQPLLEAGARWAGSLHELASRVDTLITCLPSSAAVDAVMLGPDGALAVMRRGSTWIEMSTNDRRAIEAIAAVAATHGVACLEAPVTGGVHRAAAGAITVLVGGDRSTYEAQLPILQAVGGEVFHLGDLGKASVLKVITNMLAFIHLVAMGESLMLAKRADLDLGTVFAAIRASSGNSFVHETEGQVVLNGSYDIGFTMDLACKDLGFATQLGVEHGVPLELARLVEETFHRARDAFGGSAWSPMVVKLLEDALGEELRAPGFPAVLPADG